MRVAILSNLFEQKDGYKEVEEDLTAVGNSVKKILEDAGHEAIFFDVNEKTFETLRRSKIDVAFNVCERFNGSSLFEPHIASMLELLNIPYTGSGPLTLATCINKARVKEILMHHGILTPNYQVFYSRNKKLDPELSFPLIVKPVCMDNSIGITNDSVVHTEDELRSKVSFILRTYDQPALVEEYIDGREITVGILGNGKSATVLPIAEAVFADLPEEYNKILSYDAKWYKTTKISKETPLECPANIPKYQEYRIKRTALQVYNILGCRDYGRVDFRLSKEGVPYVLEMNPNPGLSPVIVEEVIPDFIPVAAKKSGLEYNELILKIFEDALERHDMTIKVMPSMKSLSDKEKELSKDVSKELLTETSKELKNDSAEEKEKIIKVEPDLVF